MTAIDLDRSDAVAAYASLEGAERAVAHLVSCGYDEDEVGIGPRDYEVVDEHVLRRQLGRWVRLGTTCGAVLMLSVAVVAEIGRSALISSVLPLVAWGAVAGTAVGLVTAMIAYRVHQARTVLGPLDGLEPTRFEILTDHDRDHIRNDLARWWDPSHPTSGWQERT